MPFREFPKQGMAHVFATVHEICAEAGETLAENGRIERPDESGSFDVTNCSPCSMAFRSM